MYSLQMTTKLRDDIQREMRNEIINLYLPF